MSRAPWQREAQRQQQLLRALHGDAVPDALQGWLRGPPALQQQGLAAYRTNAAASAERALAVAYPTLRKLLGKVSFAALAREHWRLQPPERGDLAAWGAGLPHSISGTSQLADAPYLGDVAQLDWALHQAALAADDDAPAAGLQQLDSADPAMLQLRLRAGHAVLVSTHPVYTLWAAHQRTAGDRFAAARQALAERRAEAVRVRRHGLQTLAECISPAVALFELSLLHGLPMAAALTQAGPGLDFEAWFIDTLQRDALAAAVLAPALADPGDAPPRGAGAAGLAGSTAAPDLRTHQ